MNKVVISPVVHHLASFAPNCGSPANYRFLIPAPVMIFVYPQMLPTWQFMPFMPTYQPSLPVNLFQLQMQRMVTMQYNAALMQHGQGTFVTPHALQSIPQLDQYRALSAGQHQDRTHKSELGRHKTAAPTKNQVLHASRSMITNDHRTISHHSRVRDFNNARSGPAEEPPSSRMSTTPNHKSRSRAVIQNRSKRASAIRGQRRYDNLLQYVVTAEGGESGRPWKRQRRGGQLTANIAVLVSTPAMVDENEATESANTPGDLEQQDIPMDESGDVKVQVEMEE